MPSHLLVEFLQGAEPFTIGTVGGREYVVPHPDFAAFTPDRAVLVVFTDGKLLGESLRVNQIESINGVPSGP